MWARSPYAEFPWAAPVLPNPTPPGSIPPGIPGSPQQVYTWGVQLGVRPWAFGGWAGGIAPAPYVGGGIQATPDPNTGTVGIQLWWPDTDSLELIRATPDGALSLVRATWPAISLQDMRTNYCQNPAVRAGLNGFVPGTGSPTLKQVFRTDVNDTALSIKLTANGEASVAIPNSLPAAPGVTYTAGIDMNLSSRPTAVKLIFGWTDADGGALSNTVAAYSADQINTAVNEWARLVVNTTPPDGASTTGTVSLDVTGLSTGDVIQVSRITLEDDTTDGSNADGDVLGGRWLGVPELSTSEVAPLISVVDGECPLDVAVTYQLWNTQIVGGSVTTPPVMLQSNGTTWLNHPLTPETPLAVSPTVTPSPVRALPQVSLPIIGRPRPIVVTASMRQAPNGALSLDCPTFAYRDQLIQMMADGLPLLLRAPAEYGFGYGQWLQLQDVTEDPGGRAAYQQTRTLTGNYQEVDPPAAPNLVAP